MFCLLGAILIILLLIFNLDRIMKSLNMELTGKMETVPYAICTFYAFVFFISEVLSIGQHLTKRRITFSWLAFFIINLVLFFIAYRKKDIRQSYKKFADSIRKKITIYKILYAVFSVVMMNLAYKTVLYNYDSMCYHLSRVAEWTHNHSIGHYATLDLREISSPVLSEMILTNLYILSDKSDVLFNLSQCFAYIISGILVCHISRKIGCSVEWSRISVLLFIAMPIAFSEALNTQNDLIATMLLLCFVHFGLDCVLAVKKAQLDKAFLFRLCFLGMGIGLAYNAKYYVLIPVSLILLWILIVYFIRKKKPMLIITSICVVVLVSAIFYMPEAIRMYHTFGSLYSGETSSGQLGALYPKALVKGFVKNYCYNLSSHYIYDDSTALFNFVKKITDWLELDLGSYKIQTPFTYHQDVANGFLVCVLMLFSIGCMIVNILKRKTKTCIYAVISMISCVVFLAVLKYTPYRPRYETCYFAMLCPAISITLQEFSFRERMRYEIIGIILFISLCDIVSLYKYHHTYTTIVGENRYQGYFIERGNQDYILYDHFVEVLYLNECKTLGLHIPSGIYRYPIWQMSATVVEDIQNIDVDNETQKYENLDFVPDAVIYAGSEEEMDAFSEQVEFHGQKYNVVEAPKDKSFRYIIAVKANGVKDK